MPAVALELAVRSHDVERRLVADAESGTIIVSSIARWDRYNDLARRSTTGMCVRIFCRRGHNSLATLARRLLRAPRLELASRGNLTSSAIGLF